MQLSISPDGQLTATSGRRTVKLAQLTDLDTYRALRTYGVKASVAAAVAARVITISLKGA